MLTINDVRDAFYDWCYVHFDRVIFANQSSPRPHLPYVSIDVTATGGGEGLPNKRYTGSGDVFEMSKHRDFICQVILFSSGDDFASHADVHDLRDSLEKDTVLAEFRAQGLAFKQCSQINDISTVLDNQFERRFQFDVTFHGVMIVTDDLGGIESVEVNEKVIQ